VTQPRLTLAQSPLAPGTYRLTALVGAPSNATLTISADGSLQDASSLPELAPQTGQVYILTPTK
jgi:hypothetical protein